MTDNFTNTCRQLLQRAGLPHSAGNLTELLRTDAADVAAQLTPPVVESLYAIKSAVLADLRANIDGTRAVSVLAAEDAVAARVVELTDALVRVVWSAAMLEPLMARLRDRFVTWRLRLRAVGPARDALALHASRETAEGRREVLIDLGTVAQSHLDPVDYVALELGLYGGDAPH